MSAVPARDAYLSLLQDVIFGRYTTTPELIPAPPAVSVPRKLLDRALSARGLQLALPAPDDEKQEDVERGDVWPKHALSMAGRARMDNARYCIERVLDDAVPGDVIETGVWRGGMSIFMRAVLHAAGVTDRVVWVADSFEGLPPSDPENYPADASAFAFHEHNDVLGVSLEEVRANFASFGLLDEQVRFVKGFFRESLPSLAGNQWSVIRLDGDLYESTIQALDSLYGGLSVGGWLIIDDYNWVPECKKAVDDFREREGIADPVIEVDRAAVYWQRSA